MDNKEPGSARAEAVSSTSVQPDDLRPMLTQVLARVRSTEAIQQELRDLILSQRQIKDYYSPAEAATVLGKAEFTVREWCRLERVHAQKRRSGRGRSLEWVISHEELQRIQREGLLPVPKYRA